jgi:N-acetylglucosaminyldiphosphoundecaprenol N-acetyl-beta-D-mannosaminyltransferase
MSMTESEQESLSTTRQPCWLFDIPFAPLTLEQAASEVERLVLRNVPSYLITANTNYAMLVSQYPDLHEVNRNAALIVADGIHMVWASRMTPHPLPERVTGTDLIHQFSALAAHKGYSLFLLGAAPGVAEQAARNLCARYPGLRIAGIEAPMFKDLTPDEHEQLIARIREARPDLLLLAMGQPQGERWLFQNHEALGVPVSIQIGGSLDYIAGRIPRAPRWMRTIGLEAPYRMCCEPARLIPRYSRNALFLAKALVRFALSREYRRQDRTFD